MLPQITIRQARLEDIASLTDLLAILFSIEEDFVVNETRQHNGLMLLLGSATCCVLVAEIDNRVVGMCTGPRSTPPSRSRSRAA